VARLAGGDEPGAIGHRGRRRGQHYPGPGPRPERPDRCPAPRPGRGPRRLRRVLPAARGDASRRVARREFLTPCRIRAWRGPNRSAARFRR
jgi:hypothetical protein